MKVFLSSTAQDLEAYRRVADDTILRLAQQSIVMERFGPLPDTPVEECERLARQSDVVICVVAHRYGYIPEKGHSSINRREVEAAHKAGKDVLVWIVDDDHPWTDKKEQDLLAEPSIVTDPAKVAEVAGGVAGLLDFKAWLRKTFTPDKFTTPDDLGRKIAVALVNYVKGRNAPPIPQDKISIARLPTSGAELFGRETELKLLDDAWANPSINIISFVAWGGVGKTALVNHWLKRRMARDNYRGAERVYGWSFFSQGTTERAASADLFIDQALRWFRDPDPIAGSSWDKGERLAGYIRQSRTLLILDGLEALQHPPGFQEGRLKDAAMQAFLGELAAQQLGLCVISTRERIGDLIEFEYSTVVHHDLEYLSPQAGTQILRSFNVKGDDQELEDTAKEFGGHAFSLTLLGSYLDEVVDGDMRRRKEIENLFDDTRYGDAAQKMIAAYETWLGEGMELAILRLLGLFDRPADLASIEVLRKRPVIVGLTEPLQNFKAREWNQATGKLRRIRLLGEVAPHNPSMLDAHPLVREYFKRQLKLAHNDAWREANNRLYEHLKKSTKEFPNTLEEMSPLLAAVAHGCSAGKYEEAFNEVFWRRIHHGTYGFGIMKLGAIGANLASLTGFFDEPWHRPVTQLNDVEKGYLLSTVGFCLRSAGRLSEATHPLQAAQEIAVESKDWKNASRDAFNLSEVYLHRGELDTALKAAEQSVKLAEHGTGFEQVFSQSTLANVLHQTGRDIEAEEVFIKAEALLQTLRMPYPFLYSVAAFNYCDLLLAKGQARIVKERGQKLLERSDAFDSLLDIGLNNLSLGRGWLAGVQHGNLADAAQAAEFLRLAIEKIRQAGTMEFLPYGLMVRAQLYRFTSDFGRAERDLAEVHRIATRSGMGLHLADYNLESARLQLAQDNSDKAREHLTTAKEMIDRMGYHRRDREIAELEAQLA